MTAPAIVTEAHVRSVVAGIRGLGRAGVRVHAMGPRGAAGRRSRWAASAGTAPDAQTDGAGHAAAVRSAADADPGAILYPSTEWSLTACLSAAEPADALRLPYGRLEALRELRDKDRMASAARRAGLLAPATLYAGLPEAVDVGSLPLPCVVKPAGTGRPGPAIVARDRGALQLAVRTAPSGQRLLIQEHADGPLMAVAVVLGPDGALLAEFHQRTLNVWPTPAGVSARAVGVPPDPGVRRGVVGMLASAGFSGLAQVQYLATGRGPVVIDVNPRFYGSLPLAMASGVNLPAIWHRSVCGTVNGPPPPYRSGVSYRWMEADLLSLRTGRLAGLRPPPRPRVGAWWSADDPLPGLALSYGAVAGRIRRRIRR